MDANELRIGNLIYRNGNLSEIKYYDFEHFVKKDDPRHYIEWNSIKPIPLTLEWLLNFGFKKDKQSFVLDNIDIGFEQDIWGVYINTTFPYTFLTDIKYVHEVQNLFFALKGKELTLK